MKRLLSARAILIVFVSLLPPAVQAQSTPLAESTRLPKWELGIGAGMVSMPDYRGSDEQRNYAVPVPFFIYRGDFLRADRGGVRGRLFDSQRLDLEISLNANPPVRSKNNAARQGMPDLKPSIEIGPQTIVRLIGSEHDSPRLDLRLPLRAVVDTGAQSRGWVFTPALNLSITPRDAWHIGAQIGAYYGSETYHNYLYGVDSRYATASRAAYHAQAGYAGWQVTGSLSRRYENFWFGSFIRATTVKGAVFEDSPLVRRKNNFYGGFGFAWIFDRSAELVAVVDED